MRWEQTLWHIAGYLLLLQITASLWYSNANGIFLVFLSRADTIAWESVFKISWKQWEKQAYTACMKSLPTAVLAFVFYSDVRHHWSQYGCKSAEASMSWDLQKQGPCIWDDRCCGIYWLHSVFFHLGWAESFDSVFDFLPQCHCLFLLQRCAWW